MDGRTDIFQQHSPRSMALESSVGTASVGVVTVGIMTCYRLFV